MSANNTDDINKPVMHLRHKGGLSLSKIADLIIRNDDDCIDSLIQTIHDCMAAKQKRMHVEAIIKLAGRCTTIRSLIHQKCFPRSKEILQAFDKLDAYLKTGIPRRLN